MRLSLHTDYGLRVLMHVCASPPESRLTVDDVAQGFGISRDHLRKVVQSLVQHGFLVATRGRSGGLQLARSAESIGLGDVLRALEANHALVECQAPDGHCVVAPACGLERVLRAAHEAFYAVLDGHSLQDVVHRPEHFVRLLNRSGSLSR